MVHLTPTQAKLIADGLNVRRMERLVAKHQKMMDDSLRYKEDFILMTPEQHATNDTNIREVIQEDRTSEE